MGVPKFFRYLSERYPCLSEFVKDDRIPTFDNLYLDMNGIIHICSHPEDNNPHFRITEDRLYADIFHYIDVLFRMIRPLKVFFLAIDGVAPRSKMNQQRARRFCTAKLAQKLEEEARRKGEILPTTARFDSNCVTPGTEFMAKLHEQLKYFIVQKISNDESWKTCKIILSGHDTPGEGEHKIMDYIRYLKAQPGYDPHTRHCLYGSDADLIMLGLCTHEPHFSLLREEVKFGRKSDKRSNVPEETRFFLLHLSLMREYLELEFNSLKEPLSDRFDIEKIIDDWVLMVFLVGNDFIPHLPDLHIANGALPILYKTYMETAPTLDGYINESGTLNLERFEKFLERLGEFDIQNFEEVRDDILYMEAKTGRKYNPHAAVKSKVDFEETDSRMDPSLAALIKETQEMCLTSSDESLSENDDDEDEAFTQYKKEYYMNKLEYSKVTPEVLRDQAEGYVRAIQWNLNYYYNGVCSWSWYYPHHYAPYISDIKNFSNLQIEFELGRPFKPFEQLLAVLPVASKSLLPECYHHLMTDDDSLIKKYYPENFETDLNGKKQDWEAVVLVPFIQEDVLLTAMAPYNEKLTDEERKRNSSGPLLTYVYTNEILGVYKCPGHFNDVKENHAFCVPKKIDELRLPKEQLIKGLYPGVNLDVYYPGFPTMKHLKYKGELKYARIKVFEQPSRNESMIISIIPKEEQNKDSIPTDLIGETVFVQWPHLTEAKVVAISTEEQTHKMVNNVLTEEKIPKSLFDSQLEGVSDFWLNRMGIDFGDTNILVHTQLVIGRKYQFTTNGAVCLEKKYADTVSYFPIQTIVRDIKSYDDHNSVFKLVTEVFPIGSLCFSLTNPHYGCKGIVVDNRESLKSDRLKIELNVETEPDLRAVQTLKNQLDNSYFHYGHLARKLSIPPPLFSRITSSVFLITPNAISTKGLNIGLNLKFYKRNQEIPGYSKKIDNNYFFSEKAASLVEEYLKKFPEVFHVLNKEYNSHYKAEEVFGYECEEKVQELKEWLRNLPTNQLEKRVCGGTSLEPEIIKKIEEIVDDFTPLMKTIKMQIKPQYLHKPNIQIGNIQPDPFTETQIFDRIINVRSCFTVPLGLKGTVIGIIKTAGNDERNKDETSYEVMFDEAFAGGLSLDCKQSRCYHMSKTAFINLSYGKRVLEQKTGCPGALLAIAKVSNAPDPFQNRFSCATNSAFASIERRNVASHTNRMHMPNYVFNQPNVPMYCQQPYQPRPHFPNPYGHTNASRHDFMPKFSRPSQSQPQIQMQRNAVQFPTNPKPQQNVTLNTDLLKKMLKIDSNSVNQPGTSGVKNGAKPPNKSNSNQNGNLQNAPKSIFQRQERTQNVLMDMFSNVDDASSTTKLLIYYQSNSLGCPRYTYIENKPNVFVAQLILPDNKVIVGRAAHTREEASENVSHKALKVLIHSGNSKVNGPVANFPTPPEKWVQKRPKEKPPISFIPLQAIKQRQRSQNKNNQSTINRSANIEVNNSDLRNETNTKPPQQEMKMNRQNKSRRQRIAANFNTET